MVWFKDIDGKDHCFNENYFYDLKKNEIIGSDEMKYTLSIDPENKNMIFLTKEVYEELKKKYPIFDDINLK